MAWTRERIPDQTDRVAIVTGSNTGIGFAAADMLAKSGATVVLACRNLDKATEAKSAIEAASPAGSIHVAQLDLSSLDSIREFAEAFESEYDRLDLLINNAGVMMPKSRQLTDDGFEIQFGVNHLGHFALTGLLFDRIANTPGARVVNVSSLAHRYGKLDFADPNWENRRYRRVASYGQSKLANLLFTLELQRRFHDGGIDAVAVAAHPGWTATDLQRHTPTFEFLNRFLAMKPEQGALPTVRAAVDPEVEGGEYFGPDGFRETRGYPVVVGSSKRARSVDDAAKLWALSESLTGVEFGRVSAAA